MKSTTYRLEILNWAKYNSKKKRGHESIMLSCRFFDDAKIMRLTPLQRLIYIRCLLIAGDFSSSSIEVHPEMIARSTGVPLQMVSRSLFSLQENQLVKIENQTSLIEENNKENKKKEIKRTKEKNFTSAEFEGLENTATLSIRPKSKKETDEALELRKRIRDTYSSAYFQRYGVDVIFNKEFNSKIKSLAIRMGEEAIEIVKFYLTHNDSFYIKSCHSIGLCLRDCEALRTQMLKGIQITNTKLKSYEKEQTYRDTIEQIRRDGEL